MADEPTRQWSDEQLKSDDLPKKDIIKFIQDNAAHSVGVARPFGSDPPRRATRGRIRTEAVVLQHRARHRGLVFYCPTEPRAAFPLKTIYFINAFV